MEKQVKTKSFRKLEGIIGYYFHKFDKNVSVWHKIETKNGKKTIIKTLRLNIKNNIKSQKIRGKRKEERNTMRTK